MPNNSSPQQEVNDVINAHIPTMKDLFHLSSQFDVKESESFIGVCHYVVSLLYFLEHCTRNENLVIPNPGGPMLGETPYDVLIKRAPYIPYQLLTAENAEDGMLYIQAVLEKLEFYVAKKTFVDMPAYDSGSDEWLSDYQLIANEAYRILAQAYFPFTIPYHQPLDVIRTYLAKLHTNISELTRIFAIGNIDSPLRLVLENLQMSKEDYLLMSEFKTGTTSIDVFALYGFKSDAEFQASIYKVDEFLRITGLTYRQLLDVLQTSFINPGMRGVAFIEGLFSKAGLGVNKLFKQLTDIKTGASDNTFDAVLRPVIQNFLTGSDNPNLDPLAFKKWVDNNFVELQNTVHIMLDELDPGNYSMSFLATLQSASVGKPAISDEIFKRLYFFTRLIRITGLKIQDLDMLLSPLSTSTNDIKLRTLAHAKLLSERLHLTHAEVRNFYGSMDAGGRSSTYNKLFLTDSLSSVNKEFLPDGFGNILVKNIAIKSNGKFNPVICQALRVTPEQVDTIVKHFGIADPTLFVLSLENISVLYGYVLLSRSLNVSLNDFLDIIKYFGNDAGLRKWDIATNKFTTGDLDVLSSFCEAFSKISSSAFSVQELLFVLGAEAIGSFSNTITEASVQQMLLKLRTQFSDAEFQNLPIAQQSAIDLNFIKSKFSVLYDNVTTAHLIGILSGSVIYGYVIAAKPALTIPEELKKKISYSQVTGRIQLNGLLTLNEWNTIADITLKNVIQPLFDKPFNFIKETFSAFITTDQLRNELVGHIANPVPLTDKMRSVFALYQPYLVERLKLTALVKELAGSVSMHEKIAEVVTRSSILSFSDLVTNLITQIPQDGTDFPDVNDFRKVLLSVCKASLFVSKFNLTYAEIDHFLNNSTRFSDINFKDFSLEQWNRIHDYTSLRKFNNSGEFTFIDLFNLAGSPAVNISSVIKRLVMITGWLNDDVQAIVDVNGYTPDVFRDEITLMLINKQLQLVNKTGVQADKLSAWANCSNDFDSLNSVAAAIRECVIMQYDGSSRSEMESTISSKVYENQRTALASYILTMPDIRKENIHNFEELSNFFYFDIPMQSVMPVTRIRFMMNVIQTFVRQCHMRLQSRIDAATGKQLGVAPEYIDREVWEPKSLFRVWQVTMTFLSNPYPYLSYKFLNDKSEAAIAFEEEIVKGDASVRAIETAYRTYFQSVTETANLEIVSQYIDDSDQAQDASSKLIHVIGKTRSNPSNYYYCTKNKQNQWSFWKKLPFKIRENDEDTNGQHGAHVIFAKFSNRHYLFLPEFIPRQVTPKRPTGNATTLSTTNFSEMPLEKYWEVKLGVSEYIQGFWSEKKYLKANGDLNVYTNVTEPDVSKYFFTTKVVTTKIDDRNVVNRLILLMNRLQHTKPVTLLEFEFKTPNAMVTVTNISRQMGALPGMFRIADGRSSSNGSAALIGQVPEAAQESEISIFFQNIRLKNKMEFPLSDTEKTPVILSADEEMFITFSPQFSVDLKSIYSQPFFFHDKDRSYFVTSVDAKYAEPSDQAPMMNLHLRDAPDFIKTINHPHAVSFMPFHLNQE